MSEKMYTHLLRLYPSSFRKEYEGEALQLVRDRLRDERGFFNRARLWWDLVADLSHGLPRAYLNSYSTAEAASLLPHAEGIPSFKVLDKEPLGRGSILVGGTLTLVALVAFGFVLSLPNPYQSPAGANRRMSAIETVVEHLNRTVDLDSPVDKTPEGAKSPPAGTGEPQAGPFAAASASNQNASSPGSTSHSGAGGGGRGISIQKRNLNGPTVDWPVAQQASGASPQSVGQRDSNATGKLATNRVAVAVWSGGKLSPTIPDRKQIPISTEEPRLENANSAMIRLFQTHDIVMFGEVHDSKQEYEWLCKLVKTPGFADHVDDIVVEFGNPLYQKTVDRYIAGEDVPFDEVQKAWRNMVADAEPVSPVYGWLYKAVREANMQHPGKRGIRLLLGSPPGDWSKINNSADLAPYEAEKEQWYENVVKEEVLAKHRHALLIMGAWHFLRGHDQALQFELAAQQHRAVPIDRAQLGPGNIERELRAAGADPYLVVFGTNAIDNRGDVDKRFDSWPAPVIVPLSGNWVGALPAQPVITGGHAPAIPLTLADQADALLYIAPCSVLQTVHLSKADIEGTSYGQEMIRRDMILLGHPATFPYGAQPQCVQPQQASR